MTKIPGFSATPLVWTAIALAWAVRVCGQAPEVTITQQPADAVTNVGGVASFRVTATGAATVSFQWLHEGQPIDGATRSRLVISPIGSSHAGRYQAQIKNQSSSSTSKIALLTVNPPPALPIVDPLFHGDARLNTTPTCVQVLTSGELVLGPALDGRMVRFRADGILDPNFAPGLPEARFSSLSEETRVYQFIEQPDGRLLVVGNFATYERRPAPGLVRLNRDGARDDSFVLPDDFELLNLGTSDIQRRVALQSDGRILVLTTSGLQRLWPDGQRDLTFAPAVGENSNIAAFAVAGDDRIYTGLSREKLVTRLRPDGTEDPTFSRRAADVATGMKLHVLADGRLIVNGVRYVPNRLAPYSIWTLARWGEDGSPDPTFPVLDVPLFTAPAADGTLYLGGGITITPDGLRAPLALGFGPFDRPVSTIGFPAVFGPDGRLYLYGGFNFYHGVSSARVVRLNRVPADMREVDQPPRILEAWSDDTNLTLGQSTVLHVAAVAPGPVTYEWRRVNADGSISDTVRTNTPAYVFKPRYLVERGNWTVRVLNSAGEAISAPINLALRPPDLRIVGQPTRVAIAPGRLGSLSIELIPFFSGITRAVWTHDGVVMSLLPSWEHAYPREVWSETGVRLELGPASATLAGTYELVLTDASGRTVTSEAMVVTIGETPRMVNLSTRAFVGNGEEALVLGFVIPPGPSRVMLVRGIGPSLAQFGVAGALVDPRLELFDQTGRRWAVNDHWRETGSNADFARVGAFELDRESKEAMLVNAALPPGAYTVRLSGPPGDNGIGLIELYEADDRSERFVNLSSRVYLAPGKGPAIAGLAIRGPGGKRVLVRAAGPALASFGVAAPLGNPRLEVRAPGEQLVGANDDWTRQDGADEVSQAAIAAGAFAFSAGSRDAALILMLPAGNFTVLVTGASPTDAGIALLEVYELP